MAEILTSQRAMKRLLMSANQKSIGQAYIFEGMKGVGKFTAAKVFATAIHCSGEKKPCGKCPDCTKHFANTHSDLIVLGDETSQIKVDDIRSLTSELYIRPALSDKKIFVIRNADGMNPDAQNALLKSFEEPPEYAVLILLSENVKNLLPTIRSRGMRVEFEPFPMGIIESHVEKNFPEKRNSASFVAKYSGGVIGRAVALCESEDFFEKREKMFQAVSALTGDRLSIFDVAENFGIKSPKTAFEGCDESFDLFLSFMRDVLAVKTKRELINSDKEKEITEFSSKVTLAAVLSIIERTTSVRAQLNVSMKFDLWIVNMLINCWEDIHGKGSRS